MICNIASSDYHLNNILTKLTKKILDNLLYMKRFLIPFFAALPLLAVDAQAPSTRLKELVSLEGVRERTSRAGLPFSRTWTSARWGPG